MKNGAQEHAVKRKTREKQGTNKHSAKRVAESTNHRIRIKSKLSTRKRGVKKHNPTGGFRPHQREAEAEHQRKAPAFFVCRPFGFRILSYAYRRGELRSPALLGQKRSFDGRTQFAPTAIALLLSSYEGFTVKTHKAPRL